MKLKHFADVLVIAGCAENFGVEARYGDVLSVKRYRLRGDPVFPPEVYRAVVASQRAILGHWERFA